jgi:hypothetical protein
MSTDYYAVLGHCPFTTADGTCEVQNLNVGKEFGEF